MWIRQALDEAAANVETELADQPEIQAAVRSTIGLPHFGQSGMGSAATAAS